MLAVTTSGAWEAWILHMLLATEDTATWTLAQLDAMRKLIERTAEFVRVLQKKQIGLNKLFLNTRFLELLTQDANNYRTFGSK